MLIKFYRSFFLFRYPPSIHRPAGPSQSPKPQANGAGKSQTSELSVRPSPSPHHLSPSTSVTPPASKGNMVPCVVMLFCLNALRTKKLQYLYHKCSSSRLSKLSPSFLFVLLYLFFCILSLSISEFQNGQRDITANGPKSESKISKVLNLR